MLKHGFLEYMRNKSLTELVRVIVTEMIPTMKIRQRWDQFRASTDNRNQMGMEMHQIFDCLPRNILSEILKEKTRSADINLDAIENMGNDMFSVPSTSDENAFRIVNMQDGKCNCIIVTEKGIICRHLFGVIAQFGDICNYSFENINIHWFLERYKIKKTSIDSSERINNKSNESNSNSNCNTSSSESNNNNSNDIDAIPIPKTDSKLNDMSAQTILGQLKTITGLVYSLKMHTESYTEFRSSQHDESVQKSLNQYVLSLSMSHVVKDACIVLFKLFV